MAWKRPDTYNVWSGMMNRCYNPKCHIFKYYGGRGITVCERWRTFKNFRADMPARPGLGHDATIERINNNGNYEPGNVKWATMKEQCLNTRTVRLLTVDGITDSIKGWAGRLGVSRQCLMYRLRRGWSVEKTVLTPSMKQTASLIR